MKCEGVKQLLFTYYQQNEKNASNFNVARLVRDQKAAGSNPATSTPESIDLQCSPVFSFGPNRRAEVQRQQVLFENDLVVVAA